MKYLLAAVQPESLKLQLRDLLHAGTARQRACRNNCGMFEQLLLERTIEFDRHHAHHYRDSNATDDGGGDSWGSGSELEADLPLDDVQDP